MHRVRWAETHSLQSHSTIKRGRPQGPQWPLLAPTNDDTHHGAYFSIKPRGVALGAWETRPAPDTVWIVVGTVWQD
jgi:hypothetical protein